MQNLLNIDLKSSLKKIIEFIRQYAIKLKRGGAIIGLSGGVDSSFVLKLCTEAIGKERTLAVILPERDSTVENIKDAVRFAKELGVRYIYPPKLIAKPVEVTVKG